MIPARRSGWGLSDDGHFDAWAFVVASQSLGSRSCGQVESDEARPRDGVHVLTEDRVVEALGGRREERLAAVLVGYVFAHDVDVHVEDVAHAVVESDLPLGGRAVFQRRLRLGSVPNFKHLLVGGVVIEVERLNGPHADAGVPHELERGVTPGSKLEGLEVVEDRFDLFELEHLVAGELAIVHLRELDELVKVRFNELSFFAPLEEHAERREVVPQGDVVDVVVSSFDFGLFQVVAGEVVDVVDVACVAELGEVPKWVPVVAMRRC